MSFPYGAYHAAELQYLFSLPEAPLPGTLTPAQQRLAATMQRYWTGFAALGAPSRTGAKPRWPAYSQDLRAVSAARPTQAHDGDQLRRRTPLRLLVGSLTTPPPAAAPRLAQRPRPARSDPKR